MGPIHYQTSRTRGADRRSNAASWPRKNLSLLQAAAVARETLSLLATTTIAKIPPLAMVAIVATQSIKVLHITKQRKRP